MVLIPKTKNVVLKMGSADFRVFFTIEKTQLYGYLFSIKKVVSFPLIPPVANYSKDKCPNDKNQLVLSLSPH